MPRRICGMSRMGSKGSILGFWGFHLVKEFSLDLLGSLVFGC